MLLGLGALAVHLSDSSLPLAPTATEALGAAMPPVTRITATATVTATSTPSSPPSPTSTPTPSPSPSPTPTPCPHGQMEQHTYHSAVSGQEHSYYAYLPPCYDAHRESPYPVLFLLHGWPVEPADWDQMGIDVAVDKGIREGTVAEMIVIMPESSERLYVGTSGGPGSFEAQMIDDLLPLIEREYHVRTEQTGRAIGGISRGGVWALEIAFRNPTLFTVVGAHSPALSVNLAPPLYDPFYLLDDPALAEMRIYLDAGDADWAREGTEMLHTALESASIEHQYAVHEGMHRSDLWAAHLDEYLAFYSEDWLPGTDNASADD